MKILTLLNPLNLIEDLLDGFRQKDPIKEEHRIDRIAAKMAAPTPKDGR